MNPVHHRRRVLLDISKILIFPPVALCLFLRVFDLSFGTLAIPCHILFIALWTAARNTYSNIIQQRQAEQLGARLIPQVVGRWPGNIDVLLKMMRSFKTSYVLDVYLQLFEEYQCTTLNTRIFWTDNIISMDQEHSKFVLSTGFRHFWRGTAQRERMESFLGEGIFNRDDEHRATARPFFARERISDFDIFERHTARTLSILSNFATSGIACEAQDLYARFSLDAASEFLFGKNLDTISASLPVAGKTTMGPKGSATTDEWGSFAQAFEMAQQIITTRGRIGHLWPLFELFWDKSEPHIKVIRSWLDPLVKQALNDKIRIQNAGLSNPVADKTFIQHLSDSTNASRDTTACVLTFITYFMATHPDVTKRLREEVLQQCDVHAQPTYEQLKNLKYNTPPLPTRPLNVRQTRSSPCTMPASDATYHDHRPLYMPASTTIMYLPLLMQRNPTLWGPDADLFDPERWLDPIRLAPVLENPAIFAPFSMGPRICLGQDYAYNEMSYFLVRLLQQFDEFTLAPECQPEGSLPPPEWQHKKGRQTVEKIWPAAALTLFVKGGLWVRFGKSVS
ncbi:cytochrome P450 monooxygenase CYP63 [Infundibulicybe gibba]|nr:cytochrome P450 monooxygenase CYP63 [Infundibulicybe gibba]